MRPAFRVDFWLRHLPSNASARCFGALRLLNMTEIYSSAVIKYAAAHRCFDKLNMAEKMCHSERSRGIL